MQASERELQTATPESTMSVKSIELSHTLNALFCDASTDEQQTAVIPAAVLVLNGFSKSAAKHAAYWSPKNPGGKVAAAAGLKGTLQKDGTVKFVTTVKA